MGYQLTTGFAFRVESGFGVGAVKKGAPAEPARVEAAVAMVAAPVEPVVVVVGAVAVLAVGC